MPFFLQLCLKRRAHEYPRAWLEAISKALERAQAPLWKAKAVVVDF